MPFALFKNENAAQGLSPNAKFQIGVNDLDPPGTQIESGVLIPTATDAAATWVYYDVAMIWYLDSGIVTHRKLPQVDRTADTLGSCDITDATIDRLTGRGVNLNSNDQYQDIVQRMAHSQYWLNLTGQAMRVGEQVPIPNVVKLSGGAIAIPYDKNPQWAYNKIVGNYSGLTLWHAQWSLWYTFASPPRIKVAPTAPNLAVHTDGSGGIPKGMQSPISQPDDLSQASQPAQKLQSGVSG